MKYIDAEKLKAEIQKRIEETKSMKPSFDQFWTGQISAFKGCLSIIDSLQQEQPDVDLEEDTDFINERARMWKDYKERFDGDKIDYNHLIRHFYELGLNTRKED